VHAADDALRGARVVVLDEFLGNAQVGVDVSPVGLVEEAALIAVDDGLDQDRPLDSDGRVSMGAAG
jgi:hypothetical protein